MKVELTETEWFPVYEVSPTDGGDVEITEEFLERFDKAHAEFCAVQKLLKVKAEEQNEIREKELLKQYYTDKGEDVAAELLIAQNRFHRTISKQEATIRIRKMAKKNNW